MQDPVQKPDHSRDSRERCPPSARRNGRRPLVSILVPTYNRRRYLPESLGSALRQTYRDIEVFVINDGGEEVADVVQSFNDPRVVFIDRKENRGKPFSLNEALARAQGEYVAYLDDDDKYYPHHVETLVTALENESDCHAAYSDLYAVHCRVESDGRRTVLSKNVDISRDFDRFMMLYFNHVLHVSLMHRRDLLDKTGLYNENLNILIDWDLTRRMAFFSDFRHVPVITGEYYCPVAQSDRISVRHRRNTSEYLRNVLAIRTTRPAKPWSKIEDLAVILLVDRLDKRIAETLRHMWRFTFYPYKAYVPLPPADIARLDVEMPNVEFVPVDPLLSPAERVDAVLPLIDAAYAAIVPNDFPIGDMWVENALHVLIGSSGREGLLLKSESGEHRAAVYRRADLEPARRAYPHLSVEASLAAAGVRAREPREEELPFQFDMMLNEARAAAADGDWLMAAQLYEHIGARLGNALWMKATAARAYFEAGRHAKAASLSREVNAKRITVDTLLLEARVQRRQDDLHTAVRLLTRAEQLLENGESSPALLEQQAAST